MRRPRRNHTAAFNAAGSLVAVKTKKQSIFGLDGFGRNENKKPAEP